MATRWQTKAAHFCLRRHSDECGRSARQRRATLPDDTLVTPQSLLHQHNELVLLHAALHPLADVKHFTLSPQSLKERGQWEGQPTDVIIHPIVKIGNQYVAGMVAFHGRPTFAPSAPGLVLFGPRVKLVALKAGGQRGSLSRWLKKTMDGYSAEPGTAVLFEGPPYTRVRGRPRPGARPHVEV